MNQGRIEDAILLQVLPKVTDPTKGWALLEALRAYVAEVVQQEVAAALSRNGELLRTMIRFQVSKQLREGGLRDELKEYLLEECEEAIGEKAHDAGMEGGRYAVSSDLEDAVTEDGASNIASCEAERVVSEIDWEDKAADIAKHLDTDDLTDAFINDLRASMQELADKEKEEADAPDQEQAE